MIVLDASAALSGLLNAGATRRSLVDEQLHAPHLGVTTDIRPLKGIIFTRSTRSTMQVSGHVEPVTRALF